MVYIMKVAILPFLVLATRVTVSTGICDVFGEIKITKESGEIRSTECVGDCDVCKWIFVGLPTKEKTLVLNMTTIPNLCHNAVSVDGDDFIDEDDPPDYWCTVLGSESSNHGGADGYTELIRKRMSSYPNCRVRSGVPSPAVVEYEKRNFCTTYFVIEYQVVTNFDATASSSLLTSSHNVVFVTSPHNDVTSSEATSSAVNSPTNAESLITPTSLSPGSPQRNSTLEIDMSSGGVESNFWSQTYTIAIVAAAVAVVLIAAVLVMLFAIRRKKKGNSGLRESRPSVLYDIPQYATVDDCNAYHNGTKSSNNLKPEVTKEEVINPLYTEWGDNSVPGSPLTPPPNSRPQNSYEYIDIGIGNGENRSHL